jgi:ABC-2 type transport system ATP-binding protein
MITVEAENLTKRFNSFTALDDASFRLVGAGAAGYLGPNGAGKTTTLKLLTRLLRPTSGHARINGIDVTENPKAGLWDVGSVIETPDPYPQQTGQEALEMVGHFRGVTGERLKDQIRRYATELELPPLDQRCGSLSKGQRQRIVIAAAMLSEPAVILLDEPTSGLDPAERIVIRNMLVRLKRDRLVLMSSHLLAEVTEICDRAIFINNGKLILQDTVENIAQRYRETEVDIEFYAPVDPARFAVAINPLATRVETASPSRFRVSYDGTDDKRRSLLEAGQQLGPVRSFYSSTLTLEDAYLALLRPEAPPLPRTPPPPSGS